MAKRPPSRRRRASRSSIVLRRLAVVGLVLIAFLYFRPLRTYLHTRDTLSSRRHQVRGLQAQNRQLERRLPKIAFDFIEGGLEDERGLETNTSAFHKHQLLPRYLVDVSTRDQTKSQIAVPADDFCQALDDEVGTVLQWLE